MDGLFLVIVLLALVLALILTGARKPDVEVEQVSSLRGSSSGHVEVYRDGAGEWRWRAKAANNWIVAISGEGYKNKQDCDHGARVAAAVLAGLN